MNILIGSKNPTKVAAVKNVFPNVEVKGVNVASLVSDQPFSDEETREGAINRAKNCLIEHSGTLSIGLEGGVMYVDGQLFLCNWGALITAEGKIHTASGARIALPSTIDRQLKQGIELGVIMDDYANKQEVRNNEGAIGIFTNDLVSRQLMFEHVVMLLKGQWEYSQNH
ncbi:DUF84 family protein [Virgibacillus halodenitrificans]|uniref:inosine/xanthosine triphosphatase n=1 Tax=Virgibacillus halodenitrificans TaxID=1482 RepID=A0ABR7VRB5_VIRHA|nr:DUF84 family protein [Virgibacillus halodenitrificans]MBD1223881.1 DUF84 family protein [Virgibacillus halodenitrificans]